MNYDFFNGFLYCILLEVIYFLGMKVYKNYIIKKESKEKGYYFRASFNGRTFKTVEEFSDYVDQRLDKSKEVKNANK